MATKKQNKRESKKRALRLKWGLLDFNWPWVKRDSMKASRRKCRSGAGK